MNMIRDELGRNASEIFEFDPKFPIASASIGQVYRARLKTSGNTIETPIFDDIHLYLLLYTFAKYRTISSCESSAP